MLFILALDIQFNTCITAFGESCVYFEEDLTYFVTALLQLAHM